MKLQAKKLVLVVTLWVSFLWPMVHFGLVKTLDVSPWSWWGWAMYTQPQHRIEALALSADTRRPLYLNELPPDKEATVRTAYQVFSLDRMAYGKLREPEAFARAVLEAFPDPSGVRIQVRRILMDRSSGILETDGDWSFDYTREELLGQP